MLPSWISLFLFFFVIFSFFRRTSDAKRKALHKQKQNSNPKCHPSQHDAALWHFFSSPSWCRKMFSQPQEVWGIVTIIIVINTIIISYAVLQNSLLKSLKALIILPRPRQTIWCQDSSSSCVTWWRSQEAADNVKTKRLPKKKKKKGFGSGWSLCVRDWPLWFSITSFGAVKLFQLSLPKQKRPQRHCVLTGLLFSQLAIVWSPQLFILP